MLALYSARRFCENWQKKQAFNPFKQFFHNRQPSKAESIIGIDQGRHAEPFIPELLANGSMQTTVYLKFQLEHLASEIHELVCH